MFTKGELITLLQMHDHAGSAKLRAAHDRYHLSYSHREEDPFIHTLKAVLQYPFVAALEAQDTLPTFALAEIQNTRANPNEPLPFLDMETAKTKERYHHLLEKSNTLASAQKLFEYVVRGEQRYAASIVREDWLLQEQSTRRYSGKIILARPLEYAMWARDIAMCRMLIAHMSPEVIAEQVQNLEYYGLSGHGHHFNLQPYKTACENFFEFVKRYGIASINQTELYQESLRLFQEIGKAQLDFPVNYIHEYCRSDRPLLLKDGNGPSFDGANLPGDADTSRSIMMEPFLFNHEIHAVYPTSPKHGFGITDTLIRTNRTGPFLCQDQCSYIDGEHTVQAVLADYNAICALNVVLEEQYEMFKQSVLDQQQTAASSYRR